MHHTIYTQEYNNIKIKGSQFFLRDFDSAKGSWFFLSSLSPALLPVQPHPHHATLGPGFDSYSGKPTPHFLLFRKKKHHLHEQLRRWRLVTTRSEPLPAASGTNRAGAGVASTEQRRGHAAAAWSGLDLRRGLAAPMGAVWCVGRPAGSGWLAADYR